MQYLLIRNEKNVKEVIDKAYKGLSGTVRKKAEEALLKENPELKTFKTVRKGFMVRVPKTVEGGTPDRRSVLDPLEDIASQASIHLKRFEEIFEEKFSNTDKVSTQTTKNLKTANAAIKKHPTGEIIAKALKKHIADSKKSNDKKVKLGKEALEKLQKTLINFDR